MNFDLALLFLFSISILFNSLFIVAGINSIYSIFLLVFNFALSTGLLFLLESEFMALIFIIIYVGAISVLFLFVIIMLDLKTQNSFKTLYKFFPFNNLLVFLFLFSIFTVINNTFDKNYYNNNFLFNFNINWLYKLDYVTDLNLLGQYNLSGNVTPNPGMLTVKGTASYEARVLDDDHIPNKKYVDDTVSNFFGTVVPNRIQVGDTKVHVYDNSVSGPSRIETEIDGTLIQDVRPNYSDQYGIRIEQTLYGTEIKTLGTSQEDLILSATGTGHVVVDDNLRLGYTPHEGVDGVTDPAEPDDGILLYAKPAQAAGTGMYFVNAESQRDEIISKNRALIFSMLF